MMPDVQNAEPVVVYERPAAVSERRFGAIPLPAVKAGSMPTATQGIQRAGVRTAEPSRVVVELPPRIPVACVEKSASDYQLNPLVLLAILKAESNGRTGVVSKNTNGTQDLGPAQFNTGTWAVHLEKKYGIARDALINDMCQAIRAMAYAVRTEINQAGGDLWRGIGNYHSRTPVHHVRYIRRVSDAHDEMIQRGKF